MERRESTIIFCAIGKRESIDNLRIELNLDDFLPPDHAGSARDDSRNLSQFPLAFPIAADRETSDFPRHAAVFVAHEPKVFGNGMVGSVKAAPSRPTPPRCPDWQAARDSAKCRQGPVSEGADWKPGGTQFCPPRPRRRGRKKRTRLENGFDGGWDAYHG